MIKKSLLWVYRTALWLVGIIVVILLITALTIHFWLMPNIHQYKDDIAAFASKTTKQKIVIRDIKADWRGINPHLLLSNFDIFDAENRPALQLKRVDVALSWLSILMFEPHLSKLDIHEPELTIRRTVNGEIFIAGMSMLGETKSNLPNWLLRQNHLTINNAKITWLDEKREAPVLSLTQLNVDVFSPPWRSLIKNHRFTVSAHLSAGTDYPINVNGDVYGNDVNQIEKWRGTISVQLKDANLAAFKAWSDYPINLQSGVGSTDTTVKFANYQVQSITSDVSVNNLQIQITPKTAHLTLNTMSGQINWKNLNKQTLIGTQKTNFGHSVSVKIRSLTANNGLNLQDADADYTQTIQGHQAFNLKLAHVNIASIQPFVAQLPLPETILQKITASSIQGALDNIDAHWEAQDAKTIAYSIDSEFSHLSANAHDKVPGFTNLSGKLQANQKTGKLLLSSQNITLDFKDILRWPVPANKLDGEVTWQINQNTTEIDTRRLSIDSPHISGVIDANYTINGSKGDYLDLKAKFDHGDAKFAKFYYPLILGEATINWLDTSILAGQAEDINLIVKGRLDDFPFVDGNNNLDPKLGVFRVTAKISDALLEYGTGWPVIDHLGLDMLFEGKRMELNAHTGRIFGNQIIKSKTTIAQLDAEYPILNIDSEVQGPVSEGVQFVNKSPVLEVTQGFTEGLKTTGTGKLKLTLKIPMQDLEASKYKGMYQITDGSMESENIPALSQINGLLEFTENSLTAKNIKASAFSAPLVFNLTSGSDKSIRVLARGKMNDNGLNQIFKAQGIDKSEKYLYGSTEWIGDILIQKPRVNISIRSDLLGITSRLPAPLNKPANERLSLRFDKKQDANTDTIVMRIENRINAKALRTIDNMGKLQLNQASVHFYRQSDNTSESNIAPNKPQGLDITGNLDYLDADAWRYVMQETTDSSKQSSSLPIQNLALNINTLDIFNRRLNQVTLANKGNSEGLQTNIQSREISGDLQWSNQDNGRLIARLSKLTIPDTTPPKLTAANDYDLQNSNASTALKTEKTYPALDIVADNFEFNKKNLGHLELVAFPQSDNWNIQKLKLISPEDTLNAEGQWNNWMRSPNTFLNITWDINDLGKTLKRFGYPDSIKNGEGVLTGRLHWPGSPHQFDTAHLNGELQFEVRKGQILQVQPGVGRLLGLLSLQSLPRRLTLDFRDLFSNGFAFDKINATVRIEKGVMRSDDFVMSGPAADVSIKGETNLQKETQHLFVKVMPRISDSISLAALAGGPLAGAVAFLAQKILKDPLNKIASSEYEIIGTWDKPQEVQSKDTPKKNGQNNFISPAN